VLVKSRLRAIALGCMTAILVHGVALAGPPTDELKERVDRVIQTLADRGLDAQQRRASVRAAVDDIFAFDEMSRRALGRHWTPRSPDQREEFVRLFSDLLERAYASKLEQYSGERVLYAGESIDGDQATVRTKIQRTSGSDIPVDYRMLRTPDRWRVYDVVIEGVSPVANYRTQFDRIIQGQSYDELVARLRSRSMTPAGIRG
jgi:phospholipid transport system substrate-binding protein